jgi:hypothetical protein
VLVPCSTLSLATCRALEICGKFRFIASIGRQAILDNDFCWFRLYIQINFGKYLKRESSRLNSDSFHFVRIVAGHILGATMSNKSIQNALLIFNLDDKIADWKKELTWTHRISGLMRSSSTSLRDMQASEKKLGTWLGGASVWLNTP